MAGGLARCYSRASDVSANSVYIAGVSPSVAGASGAGVVVSSPSGIGAAVGSICVSLSIFVLVKNTNTYPFR